MATECFTKFRSMFQPKPTSETFGAKFEIEREQFLADNVEELKEERAISIQLTEMLSISNKRKACSKNNKDSSVPEAKRSKTQKSKSIDEKYTS